MTGTAWAASGQAGDAANEARARTSGITPGRALRILLADDNEDALFALSALLQIEGYIVEGASDGEQAVEALTRFRPDVAILDINMPKLNGYDVAERVARQAPNVSLVALSGWSEGVHGERARRAGFEFHLSKPVDLQSLRAILSGVSQDRRI